MSRCQIESFNPGRVTNNIQARHCDSGSLEIERKYWATRSSARLFVRSHRSYACSALLASLARIAAPMSSPWLIGQLNFDYVSFSKRSEALCAIGTNEQF